MEVISPDGTKPGRTAIEEHDTVPWNPLGNAMEDAGGGEFRLCHSPQRLPATYTLQATLDD